MTQSPYGPSDFTPPPTPPSAPSYPPAAPPAQPTPTPYPPQPYPPAAYPSASAYPPAAAYPPAPTYPPAPAMMTTPVYPAGSAPAYGTPPAKKSPVLAIVGLALIVIAAVIFTYCSYLLYQGIIQVVGVGALTSGSYTIDMSNVDPTALQSAIMGPVVGLGLTALAGIVGFVLSIIATVRKQGRGIGIVGIILGIIAPVVGFIIGAAMALSAAGAV